VTNLGASLTRLTEALQTPYRDGKHPCGVCGKTDEQKPMCFIGEDHCSELHRKVLAGDFGYEVTALVDRGLITQDQAVRLWGKDFRKN